MLEGLDELGRATGERGLLVIDGINEGDREAWRNAVGPLAQSAQSYPNIALVLSCRSPFDQQIFTQTSAARWVEVEHPGFEQIEFDAQIEYFAHYGVPASRVPLLDPEFAVPLFLKLLCETIRDLKTKSKRDYLRDLASGQKGMTRLLEDFVRHAGAKIEHDFGLGRRMCWRLLKGYRTREGRKVGIAPLLADRLDNSLTRDETLSTILEIAGWNQRERAEALLQRMLTDGLLLEGVRWDPPDYATFTEAIHLPYERFSDHLIARHLLEEHLNAASETTIRRSFYAHRPLGQVFELTAGGHRFRMPGIASAIMLEFPERVKRALPREERELAYYLPTRLSG